MSKTAKLAKLSKTAKLANPPLNAIFTSAQYLATPIDQFYTLTSLASSTGIDLKVLRMAKKRGLPGFKQNQGIIWRLLKPELEKQYDDLVKALANDSIGLKEELQRADLRIKNARARKLEGKLISPADVKRLLVEIAAKTSAACKKEFGELPPRLAGKAEPDIRIEIDAAIAALFKTLGTPDEAVDELADDTK